MLRESTIRAQARSHRSDLFSVSLGKRRRLWWFWLNQVSHRIKCPIETSINAIYDLYRYLHKNQWELNFIGATLA
jgi:hypothetical protein